ncbi:MAG: hypothetical protein EPN97_01775 [Alphaproteobacteria bacterium]|nr:MAG: hypothetical protein EPN97_01775 [Alphaproteobacteria bacterium]
MTSKRITRLAFILSSAAIISWSAAAQAGFEWKGPIEAPAPQPAPVSDMGGMGDLAPVTSDTPLPAETAAPMPVSNTASAIPAGEVLSGFAKDVPLVMALQQIVPPGYQYSFSSGVDAGTSVSWEGGKPWQGVLSDMLAAHGLGYSVQNNTVVVGAAQNNAMPAASPMSAPQDSMMMPMPGETASSSPSAPLNIVSLPPDSPAPAAGAPVASGMAATSAPAPKDDAVTIHREKPKSLLERLGFVRRKKEADVPVAHEAPRQMAAANVPAPMPAAAPVTATDAPAAAQQVAAVTAVPAASAWQGTKGQTLRDVLKAWSDKAGVDLYWSIDYDYRLSEDVGLAGSYEEAVGGLLDKFASVRPQPYGQLHQGNQGPRVLVIKSYDLAQ